MRLERSNINMNTTNKYDEFEQAVRDSISDFEMPYESSEWTRLEKKLDQKATTKSTNTLKYFVGSIAIIAASASLFFWNTTTPDAAESVPQNPAVDRIELQAEQIAEESGNPIASDETPADLVEQPQQSTTETGAVNQKVEGNVYKQSDFSPNATKSVEQVEQDKPSNDLQEVQALPTDKVTSPIKIQPIRTRICRGENASFELRNGGIAKWYVNGTLAEEARVLELNFDEAGEVMLKAEHTAEKSVFDELTIRVNESPEADFSVDQATYNSVPKFKFTSRAIDATVWRWDFGTTSYAYAFERDTEKLFQTAGTYTVTHYVENEFGCGDSISQLVYVDKDYNLLAPNSFSPNGDGLNETWIPAALLEGNHEFTLAVSDVNNNVIYRATSKDNPWDGSVRGRVAQRGEYFFWRAVVRYPEGDVHEYGGKITVID